MAWVALGLVAGLWIAGQWPGEDGGAAALGVAMPDPGPARSAISGPAQVIDGDTLRIRAVRIRLQGIDAPELGDVCHRPDGSGWACGSWAAEQARARFGGQRLVCHDLGERSHDRVVARCEAGGVDVAGALLEAGAARACERFARQHPHSQGYMALEAAAKAARVGIFAGAAPPRAGFCGPREAVRSAAPKVGQPVSARQGCTIKGNINARGERIYHMPGQAFHDRTVIRTDRGERWFCSEAEARTAGWRRALR